MWLTKLVSQSEFSRNIAIIFTGTFIAQIAPILASPILTRIYTPSEFGIFATYIAMATILSSVATGRYDMAIILPEKDIDAKGLATLALKISIIFSIFIFILLISFKSSITTFISLELTHYLMLLPLSIIITSIYQIKISWHTRKKDFKAISYCRVYQGLSMIFIQIIIGVLLQNSPIGLITGFVLSQYIGLKILRSYENRVPLFSGEKSSILVLAKRYIKYPKYDVLNTLLNISSTQSPNLLLTALYSSVYSGYFLLTQRVIQGPVSLLSFSVLDVFKQRATDDYKNKGHAREIFRKVFIMLMLIGFIPSLVVFFFSQEIFSVVFGLKWAIAGQYAEILAPAMFLRFAASPLSFMFHVAEKQHVNLITQILLFISIIESFTIADTPLESVSYISLSLSLYYIIHLIISAKLAGWTLLKFITNDK